MQLQPLSLGAHDAAGALALFQTQACERLALAYEPFGGVVSGDDLVVRLSGDVDQPISKVAHWIVDEGLIHFSVRGTTCIPRFQLEGCEMRPLLRRTLAELCDLYDGFELAEWFVTPNAWVGGRLPVELVLAGDSDAVDAARADRYLVRGS